MWGRSNCPDEAVGCRLRAGAVLAFDRRLVTAYPRTVGDCPNFAQSAEQNGTVPFAQTVLG